MATQSMLMPIHPTCEVCGRDLVKISAGLVCVEGHGRIVPLDEYVDRAELPVDHSKCERVQQTPRSVAARQIERAVRAAKRYELKEQMRRQEERAGH